MAIPSDTPYTVKYVTPTNTTSTRTTTKTSTSTVNIPTKTPIKIYWGTLNRTSRSTKNNNLKPTRYINKKEEKEEGEQRRKRKRKKTTNS